MLEGLKVVNSDFRFDGGRGIGIYPQSQNKSIVQFFLEGVKDAFLEFRFDGGWGISILHPGHICFHLDHSPLSPAQVFNHNKVKEVKDLWHAQFSCLMHEWWALQ